MSFSLLQRKIHTFKKAIEHKVGTAGRSFIENLMFVKIRIEVVATITKKINTVNYIFKKIYFTSCVDFFRLRR